MCKRRLLFVLCCLLILILPATEVEAQWIDDGAALCAATGDQTWPEIVSDGTGGAIVTWADERSGNKDIYIQRVDACGQVQWTVGGVVLCTATGDQTWPEIASDGAGGAIVTWQDYRSGTEYDIYAQRIDSSGAVQWTADGVALCTATGDQTRPRIIPDGTGGALITWRDERDDDGDIYAQRVDASGVTLWLANGQPLCVRSGYQKNPVIVSDGAGGAIVCWPYMDDVYAQRVNASGMVQWTANGVVVCGVSYMAPGSLAPVSDGAGGAIVAWSDWRTEDGFRNVYAQRVSDSGVPLWASEGVPICTAAHQDLVVVPDIVSDGAGGAIITWIDNRTNYEDIYAQRVDAAGDTLWTKDGVAMCITSGFAWFPEITSDGEGGAIIAWYEERGDSTDIYAQRVDSSGSVQWTTNGVLLCEAPNWQLYPTIVPDDESGAIVTWYDRRGSDYDIYAQRVRHDGAVSADCVSVIEPDGGEVWTIGEMEDIEWIATDPDGVDSVSIYYSINGGDDYSLLASGEANDGVYAWPIPDTPSDSALVKVVAYDPLLNTTEDVSDSLFSIAKPDPIPPVVEVLAPGAGDSVEVCSSHDITWTATDNGRVDSVRIYYSVNNGSDYTLIASNEDNDGVYPWTVPDVQTDEAKVKVVAIDSCLNEGEDVSDGVFIIHAPIASADDADWQADGDQSNAEFGYSVSCAGDVNGDGCDDLIVGAPRYDNGSVNEGMAFVYQGGVFGLSASADWTGEGDDDQVQYGYSVSGAGDVNNDGFDDVIVGAPYYESSGVQEDEGWAFVYHGGPTGLSVTSDWIAESDDNNSNFGNSVSSAGDVNGDGYDDVIIGAYSQSNGQIDEGLAYVYHGSASGLSSSPDWPGEEDDGGAEYGYSVSGAGDVNGDGYDDVIVGARYYGTNTRGAAFVYHGSASGLSATADWSVVGEETNDRLGTSVSGAGDVNGDGYDDVIVGAPYGGGAYVYHGSASGLSLTPDWSVKDSQSASYDGQSVSGLGDVNGDGYDDVIVGAPWYDNWEPDEGLAFVYFGSATGLSEAPGWIGEGNQAGAHFGSCVSGAGDVDCDGDAEILVGAGEYDVSIAAMSLVAGVSGAAATETDAGIVCLYAGTGGLVNVPEGPGRKYPNVLLQNYPNPFRAISGTQISYTAEKAGRVELRVFDSAGRLIRTVVGQAEAGENRVFWDGRTDNGSKVPSGVYFYEVVLDGFRAQKKILLVN